MIVEREKQYRKQYWQRFVTEEEIEMDESDEQFSEVVVEDTKVWNQIRMSLTKEMNKRRNNTRNSARQTKECKSMKVRNTRGPRHVQYAKAENQRRISQS
jgi:hypothetical protein